MAAKPLIRRTLVAATALLGTALLPTLAHATPAAAPAGSKINLEVRGEGRGDDAHSALLTCFPAGGSHPNASAACDELRAVNGDFGSLGAHQANKVCPMNLDPVVLTARGTWQGKPVDFTKRFSNRCVAEAQTGKVFAF